MSKHDKNHKTALANAVAKIQDKQRLVANATSWQNFFYKKIVLTYGCFDLLHRGHIDFLTSAKDLGHILIVAINSDKSLMQFGKNKVPPFQNEETRSLMLASFQFVDAVVVFDEETPADLIQLIKPNFLVKSSNFDANETDSTNSKYIVGSDSVRSNNGQVITLDFSEEFFENTKVEHVKNYRSILI